MATGSEGFTQLVSLTLLMVFHAASHCASLCRLSDPMQLCTFCALRESGGAVRQQRTVIGQR